MAWLLFEGAQCLCLCSQQWWNLCTRSVSHMQKVGIRTSMQIFYDICKNVARTLWKYRVQQRLISFSTTLLTVLFLARNHMTVILHPLFSPDLAPSVFSLSLSKTQLITQERFGDIIMIKKNCRLLLQRTSTYASNSSRIATLAVFGS